MVLNSRNGISLETLVTLLESESLSLECRFSRDEHRLLLLVLVLLLIDRSKVKKQLKATSDHDRLLKHSSEEGACRTAASARFELCQCVPYLLEAHVVCIVSDLVAYIDDW